MAIWLPIPRLPVCSTIQSRLSSSEEISTKWFPPPKVPNCFPILPMAFVALDSVFTCGIGFSSSHLRAVGVAALCQSKPAGTPRRMSRRICCGCSRSFNRRLVRAAIMPQPMSTPTAAGRMAPSVTITDPTVAPFPKWASGISATGPASTGLSEVSNACFLLWGSRIDAQFRTPAPPSRPESRSRPPGLSLVATMAFDPTDRAGVDSCIFAPHGG